MSEAWKTQNARDILKARAKALAATGPKGENHTKIQTVSFHLAGEPYGIELRFVREVLPPKPATPIPGVPAHIAGIINVRGEIISVTDLCCLFDLTSAPDEAPDRRYVLVLASADMVFGIFVDKVLGIQKIDFDQLATASATLSGVRVRYLKGVTNSGSIVLNGEELMSDESLIVDHTKE